MLGGREAVFARNLSHHLHESPGKSASPGFRGGDFVVGVERRDVPPEKRGFIANGVGVPGRFLLDDGTHQYGIERVGAGNAAGKRDERGGRHGVWRFEVGKEFRSRESEVRSKRQEAGSQNLERDAAPRVRRLAERLASRIRGAREGPLPYWNEPLKGTADSSTITVGATIMSYVCGRIVFVAILLGLPPLAHAQKPVRAQDGILQVTTKSAKARAFFQEGMSNVETQHKLAGLGGFRNAA